MAFAYSLPTLAPILLFNTKTFAPGGTRTHSLRIRSPTRCHCATRASQDKHSFLVGSQLIKTWVIQGTPLGLTEDMCLKCKQALLSQIFAIWM